MINPCGRRIRASEERGRDVTSLKVATTFCLRTSKESKHTHYALNNQPTMLEQSLAIYSA
jgi:hypothetical protein